MSTPDPDELARMRSQVDAAHAAADRLVQEAQARAATAEAAARAQAQDVPPRGWEVPAEDRGSAGGLAAELQAVVGLLEVARGAVPPELARQLAAALRELLLALRALIDWYLDRLDRPREPEVELQDIPID